MKNNIPKPLKKPIYLQTGNNSLESINRHSPSLNLNPMVSQATGDTQILSIFHSPKGTPKRG
jgi:hypothetical protein